MNRTINPKRSSPNQADSGVDSEKIQYQQPELEYIGKLEDFTKGGGKSGVNLDNDPQSTFKSGVG